LHIEDFRAADGRVATLRHAISVSFAAAKLPRVDRAAVGDPRKRIVVLRSISLEHAGRRTAESKRDASRENDDCPAGETPPCNALILRIFDRISHR